MFYSVILFLNNVLIIQINFVMKTLNEWMYFMIKIINFKVILIKYIFIIYNICLDDCNQVFTQLCVKLIYTTLHIVCVLNFWWGKLLIKLIRTLQQRRTVKKKIKNFYLILIITKVFMCKSVCLFPGFIEFYLKYIKTCKINSSN